MSPGDYREPTLRVGSADTQIQKVGVLMVKRQQLLLGSCIVLMAHVAPAASQASGCAAGACPSELVYVGTHGWDPQHGAPPSIPPSGGVTPAAAAASGATADADAQGIYAARLDTATGHLEPLGFQVEILRANWFINHPTLPIIYSVGLPGTDMHAETLIYSLQADRTTGKLRVINQVGSGGQDATHLDLDAASMTLFVANHGDGHVTALPIQPDGSLGPVASVQEDYGSGPTRRQSGPEAHGVAVDPTHHYVLSADFGADRIFVYQFNPATRALTPASRPFEAVAPGSGPRHLVFHPSGRFLFMDTELSAQLISYRWDARHGRLHQIQIQSTFAPGYTGEKSVAELLVSQDGRFLYVSNRGEENTLVVYAIDKRTGALKQIQRTSSLGKTPWSFAIDPSGRWMLVTNEATSSVNVLKVNPATGKLAPTAESLSVTHPVTVAFIR
jgi:6-phosphogluconolactonase